MDPTPDQPTAESSLAHRPVRRRRRWLALAATVAVAVMVLGPAATRRLWAQGGDAARQESTAGDAFREYQFGFRYRLTGVKETKTDDLVYGSVWYRFDSGTMMMLIGELDSKLFASAAPTFESASRALAGNFGEFLYPAEGDRVDKATAPIETEALSGYVSSYTVIPHKATKKGLERFSISALAFAVKTGSTRYFLIVYAYGEGFTTRDTQSKVEEFARSVTTQS